ncbi:hypothetical protein ACFLWW_02390 [Chloroflexota bacterium]
MSEIFEFKTEVERKSARFWQRFFTGAELADRLRFLTLNSSDESVVLGLDIRGSLSKLVKRIRRKYGVFEYFGVVEYSKGLKEREHLHLICKGGYMSQNEIEDMWIEIHRSIKPHIQDVKSIGGAAGYIGKYIKKQRNGRYLMSSGWIFPGFIGWSKRYKKEEGDYPSSKLVEIMNKLSDSERGKIISMYPGKRKRSRALERKRPLTAGIDIN